MNMVGNSPCMICHDIGDTIKKEKLRRMRDIAKRSGVEKSVDHNNLLWGLNSRCKYGRSCSKLNQFNRECQSLADDAEPYIISLAKAYGKDGSYSKEYFEVLRLCQGDFPAVFQELEMLRYTSS